MKIINYTGMAIGVAALILAWIWVGWELSLVLFLSIMGNNLEQK